jgi:NAD+ kinase
MSNIQRKTAVIDKKLRFAIFGNEFQTKKSASIRKVLSVLHDRGAVVYIDRPFLDFLNKENIECNDVAAFDGDDFDSDFVISMGGDGTFLKAADRVGAKGIPLVGVNMGRLGFLSDIMPSEIDKAADALCSGNYELENHAVISVAIEHPDGTFRSSALNDIAILKRDSASMITISATIDQDFLVNYQADGLIVSTPTGSTAYSLSNGGPIIVPNTTTLCLTPVAPHSLNIRPIVISDSSVVSLMVESRSHNFLVAVDGRSRTFCEGSKVTIKKAEHSISVVKLHNKRYYSTLRDKMMWGADAR